RTICCSQWILDSLTPAPLKPFAESVEPAAYITQAERDKDHYDKTVLRVIAARLVEFRIHWLLQMAL
ncbi:MAG: hypothetical protein ACRD8U_13590, partial [Pyrinomonadaceae bacterium]